MSTEYREERDGLAIAPSLTFKGKWRVAHVDTEGTAAELDGGGSIADCRVMLDVLLVQGVNWEGDAWTTDRDKARAATAAAKVAALTARAEHKAAAAERKAEKEAGYFLVTSVDKHGLPWERRAITDGKAGLCILKWDDNPPTYNITHCASGRAMATFVKKGDAMATLKALRACEVDCTVDAEDLVRHAKRLSEIIRAVR